MSFAELAYLVDLANELRAAIEGVKHPGRGERRVLKVAKKLDEFVFEANAYQGGGNA